MYHAFASVIWAFWYVLDISQIREQTLEVREGWEAGRSGPKIGRGYAHSGAIIALRYDGLQTRLQKKGPRPRTGLFGT